MGTNSNNNKDNINGNMSKAPDSNSNNHYAQIPENDSVRNELAKNELAKNAFDPGAVLRPVFYDEQRRRWPWVKQIGRAHV